MPQNNDSTKQKGAAQALRQHGIFNKDKQAKNMIKKTDDIVSVVLQKVINDPKQADDGALILSKHGSFLQKNAATNPEIYGPAFYRFVQKTSGDSFTNVLGNNVVSPKMLLDNALRFTEPGPLKAFLLRNIKYSSGASFSNN